MKPQPPEVCPVCGEDVPRGVLACPECGADHKSGWKEAGDVYDGLDLPGDEFDYDNFVQQEFGSRSRLKAVWWITAVLLLIFLVAIYFRASH
jgi:uncharacterized membrane protein YvbJ